jgi:N,N'-diacetyllegionaminate synthase
MDNNNIIIAEVGSVHDGSFGNAIKLIQAAAKCGANVVKFQTHIPEAETLRSAPNPQYFTQEGRYQYFARTAFTVDQWKSLSSEAQNFGVEFISSPFSLEAVDLLEEVGMQTYKIPSGEVTNLPMLEKISALGKPVILSSGMSSWQELDRAVEIFLGKCEVTVMQCTSEYPCPPEHVGLNIIGEIKRRYNTPVGFSDHTEGFAASISAAALGVSVIEKHFTFSKLMYGSDAKHSMEPADFKRFVAEVKDVWEMLERPVKKSDNDYREMKDIFEKSIVAASDMKKGTIISIDNLAFKKPGTGVKASHYKDFIGKELKRDVVKDEMLPKDCI